MSKFQKANVGDAIKGAMENNCARCGMPKHKDEIECKYCGELKTEDALRAFKESRVKKQAINKVIFVLIVAAIGGVYFAIKQGLI